MKAADVALKIVQMASPALMAALAWLGARVAALINARVRNEYLRGVLVRLDDTVFAVVREIQQVTIDTLKAAAPDGQLTPQVKDMAKRAALNNVKQHLGPRGLAELARVLGIEGDAVDRVIGSRVEAAVYELRRAKSLNGHVDAHAA